MPDFTPALAQGLDARRRVFYGSDVRLFLLDYAAVGRKGYDALVEVSAGWHLRGGKDIGEAMILEIAQRGAVTAQKLEKAVAFGIFIPGISEPAKVWKMQGEEGRRAPTYPTKRIWTFQVIATQEPANI